MGDSSTYPQPDLWGQWAHRASPLFRWAGGKQRFLWDHAEEIPPFLGTYHEPFAGGLSVYFHIVRRSLVPVKARLADLNLRLVRTYLEVQADWGSVSDRLSSLVAGYTAARDKARFYYDVREEHNRRAPASDAARFIFLMCAGWNGVFRVNASGVFNVPHGAAKRELGPKFPSAEDLRAVHEALQGASIRACSWESSLGDVRIGDFVFLDPPYHSHQRSDLYERSRQFGLAQHESLARKLEDLQARGVDFLLTNAATPEMIELYRSHGLRVRSIDMRRSISARVSERGASSELLVTPNFSVKDRKSAEAELDLLGLTRRRNKRPE